MAKQQIDIKRYLRQQEFDMDILQKVPCSAEENAEYKKIAYRGGALPDGIFQYKVDGIPIDEFYTIHDPGLTDMEKQEVILFEQYHLLRVIKNCVVFFTVLTVIGLAISILALL